VSDRQDPPAPGPGPRRATAVAGLTPDGMAAAGRA
jgi:hypothetical protein